MNKKFLFVMNVINTLILVRTSEHFYSLVSGAGV